MFYRFMRLNIDQITVYQSLFISKANVNRGSINGMTCSDDVIVSIKTGFAFSHIWCTLSIAAARVR